MAKSKELKAFKQHFQENCSVRVVDTIEDQRIMHWKRLDLGHLNCEEMEEVARYIKDTFYNEGMYSHILPTLGVHKGMLCLTVDVSQINEKIICHE
jgi:hypothetical protein